MSSTTTATTRPYAAGLPWLCAPTTVPTASLRPRDAAPGSLPQAGCAMTGSADAAITALYTEHHADMVRLAVLLMRDRLVAEDVVQEAFIALHARWDRLDDPEAGVGYLHRSVVNGCRSAQRRRSVATRWIRRQDPREDLAPAADQAALAAEERDQVLDALADLPRRQREVLTLRYYRDMSETEIAEVLDISRGSVKTHASRGAAALRSSLEEVR